MIMMNLSDQEMKPSELHKGIYFKGGGCIVLYQSVRCFCYFILTWNV